VYLSSASSYKVITCVSSEGMKPTVGRDQTAGRVGFATGAPLRRLLHAAIEVAARTYRRAFRTAR
jgi:hypothetical protein